ncbi:hypothetical protein [Paractinoplanes durhamensis]|uniref:DUF4832 domain-containing protein n=1 Tax=Paractinoplanes durhamensis TaxID=113563 RepID=A0ABQ3YQL5_9ACTN|nr:hypothetical protein [Actinoplanes durhamensis]GID99840.1 hypothetical protein Adu01nite_11910 [Actinoplanes durhamensis]
MRFLPAAAALVLLVPGTAHAAPAGTTKTMRYAASSASIANPGRGFFTYTETHLAAGTAFACSFAPGKPVTLTVAFKAPAKPGSYALSLALPDPSVRLAATPAYAIQLANAGVWNAGVNRLGVSLRVS